jgi:hypothetical protein
MHFCPDELLALSAALTAFPVLGPWLRARLQTFLHDRSTR